MTRRRKKGRTKPWAKLTFDLTPTEASGVVQAHVDVAGRLAALGLRNETLIELFGVSPTTFFDMRARCPALDHAILDGWREAYGRTLRRKPIRRAIWTQIRR